MSILALVVMAFLVLFSPHACNARLNHAFVPSLKDPMKTKLSDQTTIKLFHAVHHEEKASLGGKFKAMSTSLEENNATINLKGLMKKARFMLDSTSPKTNKDSPYQNANHQDEPVEDVVVTDYVSPHRKTPIHNHH